MPMLPSSTNPLLLPVFGCSIYGLYLSYKNITRLQRYESQTKTAAEWSETVAEQLRTTQTTQGAAAVTISISLLTSLYLLLISSSSPSSSSPLPSLSKHTIIPALLNAAALFAAETHMKRFWAQKVKVPFVKGWNEAVEGSREMGSVVRNLVYMWGAVAVVGGGWGRW